MNLQVLARNVRRLRALKRFSQATLAEEASLSLPAIKNLELAKVEPKMSTVQAIARALEVKLEDLFIPVKELETVRFRSKKQMQNRENILTEVARWLDDFNYLETELKKHNEFALKQVKSRCTRNDVIGAAMLCRKELGLDDDEPIHDICGLLEHAGIKVRSHKSSTDSFFGLAIGEGDGGPAIVVNVWERIPVERRIFSAAHELGHLMVHPEAFDVAKTGEDETEEREADRFAAHFLMPEKGFQKEWDEAAGLHWIDRVLKVKRIFRVSYKTVLYRLIDNGKADRSIWDSFVLAFNQKYHRNLKFTEEPMALDSSEPFGFYQVDFYEDRFETLVRESVENEVISVSRGAEMLRINIEEMQDLLRNWAEVL